MARTYLPTLVTLLKAICRYIVRNRDTLRANLPDQAQKDALEAVMVACEVFTALVEIPTGD